MYGALGLGLVLVHRASGVVNVAHGAMAMFATYVFVELRRTGTLVLPIVGPFARLDVAGRAWLWVSLAVALVVAALLGLAVHALVFRPLHNAPPLARLVASVGVMLTLQGLAVLHFGGANRAVPTILTGSPVELFGVTVPRDRLELAAIVVLAAGALWAVHRFTRFGLAGRAVADDPEATALLGWSPDAVAAVTWVGASVLAALGGILAAPIASLNPVTYSLLVVPALAAALVGRLSSFGVTVAAALGLGAVQSVIVKAQADVDWFPDVGTREALPLLVIVAAVVIGGRSLPLRGDPVAHRLPMAGLPRAPLPVTLTATAVTAVALIVLPGEERLALVTSLIGALVCLSIVVVTGYLGQLSLAQMALAGVSGFLLSRLADGAGVPFPLSPLIAAVVTAAVGVLVGLPALRVRGVSLAVVTIAGAVAVEELVFRNPALTGGFAGTVVPDPSLLGLDLGISGGPGDDYPRRAFALLVLAVVAGLAFAVARLRAACIGRRFLAVRANEAAAASAGVDVVRTKLVGFAVSAFLVGVAGGLVGYQQGRLSFGSFGIFVSLTFVALAYIGGIATVSGALVGGALVGGGIVFAVLDDVVGIARHHLLLTGIGLVVAAVTWPEGITGAALRIRTARDTR